MLQTLLLFLLTALMELLGCYLPYLCLALFVWLLSLHPAASGRVYADYGAVYVLMALVWLRLVDGVVPTGRDLLGVAGVLAGLGVLISGGAPRR